MSMLKFQIEDILMYAHTSDVDLIEEYFSKRSSLDEITNYAHELLKLNSDPTVRDVILKNLSECIVVKAQIDQRSLKGLFKRALVKMGLNLGKNREIVRAEQLLSASAQRASSHFQ